MPDAPQPTIDQQIRATNEYVGRLAHRVDGMIADMQVQRAQSRKDSAEPVAAKADDDRYTKLADDVTELKRMVADLCKRDDRRRHSEDDAKPCPPEQETEGRETEPEPMSADDDRARDDRHHREDDRRDRRADSARRAQDDENDRLTAQQDYDRAYQAIKGERAPQPMMGQSARSYRQYCAKPLQKYSEDWKDIDLAGLKPDAFALADKQIRADAIRIGGNSAELQRFEGVKAGAFQREIFRTDRTGRRISEFVGPTEAENGMFAPFCLPPRRVVRINRNPNKTD
jgi:hypothetical protein